MTKYGIRHPLESIPPEKYRRAFLPLLALTIGIMLLINWVSAPLTTPAAPLGIVSYELAGTVEKAGQILASWDSPTKLRASFGLGIDYLFMPSYALTIGLACIWAAGVIRSRHWPLAEPGIFLAWGLLLAALFDAIENIALTTMIFNVVTFPWPQVSFWCATLKFLLIFMGLVYACYSAVVRLVVKP